jgi:uncharacterized protein
MELKSPWEGASNAPPGVVLDTNAVLDWLVFGDSGMAQVAAAMQHGTVLWLACPRMREELARTLAYVDLAKWNPDADQVLSTFDQLARVLPAPPPSPPRLRCSDPDDQVFIDLALAEKARWLLTQDRALLKLARHARSFGVQVLTPKAFVSGLAH